MPTAGDAARSDPRESQTLGAPPPQGEGRPTIRTAAAAVDEVERLICGEEPAAGVAEAEGAALAGGLVATRAAAGESRVDGPPSQRVPWVHHVVDGPTLPPSGGFRFELHASRSQQALDHCLWAHALSLRAGAPVRCRLSAAAGDRLERVRIPGSERLRQFLDGTGRRNGDDDASRIAREVSEELSAALGRSVERVRTHRTGDMQVALVGLGVDEAELQATVAALRGGGIAAGSISVALLHPLPVEELGALLDRAGSLEKLIVAEAHPGSRPEDREALRRCLTDRGIDWIAMPTDRLEPASVAFEARLPWHPQASETPSASGEAEGARSWTLGAVPAGAWTDELLFDAAVALVPDGPLQVSGRSSRFGRLRALELVRGKTADVARDEPPVVDVLFAADPTLFDADWIAPGGTLLLDRRAEGPDQVAASLGDGRRKDLNERRIVVRWIDSSRGAARSRAPEAVRQTVCAALVGCANGEAESAGVVVPLEGTPSDGAPGAETPAPPEPRSIEPDRWDALRRFHLTGRGAHSEHEPHPALPLLPEAAVALARSRPAWDAWPLTLDTAEDGTTTCASLARALRSAADTLAREDHPLTQLEPHLVGVACEAARRLSRRPGPCRLPDLLDEALPAWTAADSLDREAQDLSGRLGTAGIAVGLSDHAVFDLAFEALRRSRQSAVGELNDELRGSVARLEAQLLSDDGLRPGAQDEGSLTAALAGEAARHIDPAALARAIPRRRGSKPMPAERRARIESALATLRDWLAGDDRPEIFAVVARGLRIATPASGVHVLEHSDPADLALGLFDRLARKAVDVARALKIARLELDQAYAPELHDDLLDRLDWNSLGRREQSLLPAVVVFETAGRLRGGPLATFSHLLRAGRPIRVVITEPACGSTAGRTWDALSGSDPGLGYMAVAHREAVVVQSTLAEPQHLYRGLERMARASCPAVAVVATPDWESTVSPWLQLSTALAGRATPCFVYDAQAGTTWADRFDLEANPAPRDPWPAPDDEALTFAHASALDPEMRDHFRVLDPAERDDRLVPLAEWLAAEPQSASSRLPVIEVLTESGRPSVAVVDREMTLACRDRHRAWRILQELAGTDNEYAHRAAEAARRQSRLQSEREIESLLTAHGRELEDARGRAMRQAVDNIVAGLMGTAVPPASDAALSAAPADEVAAGAAAPQAEEPSPEEDAAQEQTEVREDPYIVSALCTTCQECININPKLFRYNEDKQATIADPAAGTFKQLVTAAEKCPARCIHPGKPRPGDKTVTPKLLERAARFH